MPRPDSFSLSVIVPCFNEQEVIRETHKRLSNTLSSLDCQYEIIYVDDGSRDSTIPLLNELQAQDSHVRIVSFARNFGHQVAVTAGMDHATGDAVVLIDADLQDPPELIADFLDRWRMGYDVVYGQRTEREGETLFKRATAAAFYRGLAFLTPVDIPPDTGDFRLMDRAVVDVLRQMPEQDRFIRGMVSWVGFRQIAVPYRREARFAGVSKYPVRKMLRLASDAVIAFSTVPLRIATWAGCAGLIFSLLALTIVGLRSLWLAEFPTSILLSLLVLVIASVQLLTMGLMGEYIGRILRQVQGRPLYIVSNKRGFDAQSAFARHAA